jgi:hypothetical protein
MTLRHPMRHLVAVAATVVLLATSAGPANAERVRTPDPTGDMVVTDDMAGTTTPAPDATVGDITRVTIRYRVRALRIRVRFVDLDRTGHGVSLKGQIRARHRGVWSFTAGGGPGHWKGTASLLNPDFQETSCNLRFRIDYDINVMVLRIPSHCLERPRWVRLNFGSIHRVGDKIYEDDAFDGHWSPLVHRGPRRP